MAKQIQWLQQFLSEVVRDQTLRSSGLLYYFLSLPQKPQFETMKSEMARLPPPRTILDIQHLTGKVDISLDDHKLALARNICGYTQSCHSLYSQILTATDNTIKAMHTLSEALAKNAELYRQFAMIHAGVEVNPNM